MNMTKAEYDALPVWDELPPPRPGAMYKSTNNEDVVMVAGPGPEVTHTEKVEFTDPVVAPYPEAKDENSSKGN